VTDPVGLSSNSSSANIFVNYINLPPVPLFPNIFLVNQGLPTQFRLQATDDHTPASLLKYTVIMPENFTGVLSYVDEDGTAVVITNTTEIPQEVKQLIYTSPQLQWGVNLASFNVSIADDDTHPGVNVTRVQIDVVHINAPPVLIPGPTNFTLYYNQSIELSWRATDVDSPPTSLRGVIITFPQKGNLYQCIYNAANDSCTAGDVVTNVISTANFVDQIFPGAKEFRLVFKPVSGTYGKVYATPSLNVVDDYLAPGILYTSTIRVKAINQAPYLTVGGPFTVLAGSLVSISNNLTLGDVDAGSIPIRFVVSSNSSNVTLQLSQDSAFIKASRKPAPDCFYNADNTTINCTASQTVLRAYVSKLYAQTLNNTSLKT